MGIGKKMLNQEWNCSFCRDREAEEESGAAIAESSDQITPKKKLEADQSPSYGRNSGFSISSCL